MINWTTDSGKKVQIEINFKKGYSGIPLLTYNVTVDSIAYPVAYETDLLHRDKWAKCYDTLPSKYVAVLNIGNYSTGRNSIGITAENLKQIKNNLEIVEASPSYKSAESIIDERIAANKKIDTKRRIYDQIMNEGGEGYNPYGYDRKETKEPTHKSDFDNN